MAYYDRGARSGSRPTQINLTRGERDPRSQSVRGNFYINPELADLRRLLYKEDSDAQAVTTFRLLPAIQEGTPGQFRPARDVDRYREPYLTGWIQEYVAFKTAGCTFLCYDPRSSPSEIWETLKWDVPSFVLPLAAAAARKAKKAKIDWLYAMQRQDGPQALDFPKPIYLSFAAIYAQGANLFDPPLGYGGKPLVLNLGADAGKQIVAMALEPKPEYKDGIPHDVPPQKTFAMRDPVRADRGVFFRCFSKDSHDPRPDERRIPGSPQWWDPPLEEKPSPKGYHCYAVRSFGDQEAAIPEAVRDQIWETLPGLDEVLLFPSAEQQVALMAQYVRVGGKPLLDLFEYAFADKHPSWLAAIPEDVWREYRGTVSVAPGGRSTAPGTPSQGGTAPSPAAVRPGAAGADDEDDDEPLPIPGAAPPWAPPVDSSLPTGSIPGDDDDDDGGRSTATTAPVAAAPGMNYDPPPAGRRLSATARANLDRLRMAQAAPSRSAPAVAANDDDD
jgi:hypothetical protein